MDCCFYVPFEPVHFHFLVRSVILLQLMKGL